MTPFKEHLQRQLSFLSRSVILYDKGFHDEAIRIATTIRVLIHDTNKSTSLLKHLCSTNINLCSTCGSLDIDKSGIIYHFGDMFSFTQKMPNGKFYILEDTPYEAVYESENCGFIPSCYFEKDKILKKIPVDTWINQIIQRTTVDVRRKDLYLGASNKDGGAHVDSKLSDIYEKVAFGGALGMMNYLNEGILTATPVKNVHFVILRQMAHELLVSEELINLAN